MNLHQKENTMKNENITPDQALTQLLASYMSAKQQLVAAAIANHPEPAHLAEDIASGNLETQIIVADGWLRIVVLIAATGMPLEQPLLYFSLPVMKTQGGLQ